MSKAKPYIILNIIILLYSFSSIFSKIAAGKAFLSSEWCIFYGLVILIMGIYAIFWQQVLKNVSLNVAYANKAVTLIWGMIWGAVIFKETISLTNVIGAVIVFIGVILMVTGKEEKHE